MMRATVCYSKVTPESAEQGDCAESGYCAPGGWEFPHPPDLYGPDAKAYHDANELTLREAVSCVRGLGMRLNAWDRGSCSFYQAWAEQDSDGSETYHSLHITGRLSLGSVQRLARVLVAK